MTILELQKRLQEMYFLFEPPTFNIPHKLFKYFS